jgi:hypothetical protein
MNKGLEHNLNMKESDEIGRKLLKMRRKMRENKRKRVPKTSRRYTNSISVFFIF